MCVLAGRNPFVNQVSFFIDPGYPDRVLSMGSQSLRKSGQFLLVNLTQHLATPEQMSQSLRKSGQFLFEPRSSLLKGPLRQVAIPS